jgi:hypothetical protein
MCAWGERRPKAWDQGRRNRQLQYMMYIHTSETHYTAAS